jgi:hypothetical protein
VLSVIPTDPLWRAYTVTIFAKLEDLAGLDDAALAAKLAEYEDLASRLADGDEELVGELTQAEVVAELEAGVEQIKAMRAEQTTRAEADAAHVARLAELKGELKGADDGDGEGDAEGEGDDAGAEGEGDDDTADAEAGAKVPVAAAAARRPARKAIPAAKGQHKAPPAKDTGIKVTIAASAARGTADEFQGKELTALDIADAMIKRHDSFGAGIMQGDGVKVPVATLVASYPEERRLDQNFAKNEKLIKAVTSPQAIAASGGICAPVTPYYGLLELSVPARPVRDALPRFNADRGGIRYAIPPTLADVTTAVGLITAANDARGGTFSQKSCQHVECPDLAEVDVSIIYHCVEFGNLQSRTFPEQVAQFNELVLAAHARKAEVNLLDGIVGASTTITAARVAGAVATLLGQMITAAAGYRSRNRMLPDAPLRVLAPAWVLDALQVDVIRSQFARFDSSDQTFTGELAKANVNVSWYLDSPTGAGQVFGAQADGVLLPFPDDALWIMFAEGSFMFLDGGTLELGIVRDSVLNSQNDYQIFGESFENVAYLGIESMAVTSEFCANGEVTAPLAAATGETCLA